MKQILIIGNHPLKKSIKKQYLSLGVDKIDECDIESLNVSNISRYDEFVIIHSSSLLSNFEDDRLSIEALMKLSKFLINADGKRPTIHLLLQNQESLRMLNTRDYNDDWHGIFELNAFTIDDVWAKNIVSNANINGLDYRPITYETNNTVHLVVFGTSSLATTIVENAALVAHYPNYIRNHTLRTRITIIDNDMCEWSKKFISMHKPLMENSYYRHIDIANKQCNLHKPMYEGQREDFVDIEWEFVNGSIHDLVVQDKLQGWSDDENQVLSISICHSDDARNLVEATLVADLLCNQEIPVYVKQDSSVMKNIISQSTRMKNVILIGMKDCGYDVSLPLLKMAKRVNCVYDYCYSNNIASQTEGCITAPSYIDDQEADACWLNVKKAIKRYSNICNAMTLATKMRSLGHFSNEANTFYAITKQEIDIIAEVEHNRWNVEELLLGFRPCTDDEQAEIEDDISKKFEYKNHLIHYDLRAYNDLRADDTGQNVNTYDICISASIPLIAYKGEKGGEL